jgi:hypothetical protein
MSSIRQQESARLNGAKSKGPTTPEGKLRSSQNAIKHGLLAKTIVLRHEDRDLFNQILGDFVAEFQPESTREWCLVEELVAAKWRLRRLWGIESRLLGARTDTMREQLDKRYDNLDIATRVAFAYEHNCSETRVMANLDRNEARLLRTARNAEKALDQLRASKAEAGSSAKKHCNNEPDFANTDNGSSDGNQDVHDLR